MPTSNIEGCFVFDVFKGTASWLCLIAVMSKEQGGYDSVCYVRSDL